jgi:hypothetical protein
VTTIRRANCVFLAWKGDHGPHHVHVYRNATLVVKWDLENDVAMKGAAPAHLVALIRALRREGKL